MHVRAKFTDAQQMAAKHPDTFEAPDPIDLATIGVGSLVKICADSMERFWVKITAVDGDKITGTVDNDLLFTDDHGLKLHDVVHFEKRHIYAIWVDEEKETLQ